MLLTIQVPDDQFQAVEQVLSSFPDVTILEPAPTREERLQGLKESIGQVNLAKEGKVELKSFKQLLDEL